MNQTSAEVKSKGKTLGIVDIPEYESLEEASDFLSPETMLDYVNAGVKNKVTADFRRDNSPIRGTEKNLRELLLEVEEEHWIEVRQRSKEIMEISDPTEKANAIIALCEQYMRN